MEGWEASEADDDGAAGGEGGGGPLKLVEWAAAGVGWEPAAGSLKLRMMTGLQCRPVS